MKRTLVAFTLIAICIAILIVYKQRERTEVQASGGSAPSTPPAPSAPTMSAPSSEKIRRIDAARRKALAEQIRSARERRATTGDSNASRSTTSTPPPSLPSLPGTISKDDIRAGVRAVIPLLAECYTAAKDRLQPQAGQIVVQMHLTGEPEVGTLIDKAEIGGDAHFTADSQLVECLQQTMLSVELPPIAEGGTVDVTYPIAFSP